MPSGGSASAIIDRVEPARCKATVEKLVGFGTRHTLSETASETRGIGAARQWLKSEFERVNADSGRLEVRFEEFRVPKLPRLPDGATLVNVVATLPGSDGPNARRFYVVGHYDSINADKMDAARPSPGANDDASGVAVVLECARVLAKEKPESTIVFLCTAGEEQGLVGAKYHADQAAMRGERIAGVLNNDIVGDPSPPVATRHGEQPISRRGIVRVFSEAFPKQPTAEQLSEIRNNSAENDSGSRSLARYVLDVARREQLNTIIEPILMYRPDRFLRGGDHSAFNDAGFAAVRFTVPGEDYSRQHADVVEREGRPYGDTPEYIDADYLANVARLNAATLIHLANAPAAPSKARIVTKELTTGTLLKWAANAEADLAGYEIVLRDTSASDWQQTIDVGLVTEFTTPVSKDNVFFGVRAYDKAGYRSTVSFCWGSKD